MRHTGCAANVHARHFSAFCFSKPSSAVSPRVNPALWGLWRSRCVSAGAAHNLRLDIAFERTSLARVGLGRLVLKPSGLFAVPCVALAALAVSQASPALAQQADWITRCRQVLADDGKPESGRYMFVSLGKTDGANARAELNYTTSISARGAVYPTDAKDLLNPYSNVSLSVTYITDRDGKTKPAIGAISVRAIGVGFKPIPGAPVAMKLVVDGASFGPFEVNPASLSSGMYSVWLDTADTDGDGKPPTLSPADFAKLTKAVDAMKSPEVVLVRDSVDIVRATLPLPNYAPWRDGLQSWTAKTSPGVGVGTSCLGGGEILH